MPYVQIIKITIPIIIFSIFSWKIYDVGYHNSEKEWKLSVDKMRIESTKKQYEMAVKAKEEQEKNIALVQKIEAIKNESQEKIDNIEHDNIKLLNSGVRSRKVCRGGSDTRMSKASSSGHIIEKTAEFELSNEFKEFLISDAKRADQVGLYAEEAYQWVNELCKKNKLACPDITTD